MAERAVIHNFGSLCDVGFQPELLGSRDHYAGSSHAVRPLNGATKFVARVFRSCASPFDLYEF